MAAANNEFFEALSMLEHERGITAEYLIEKIKAAIVIAVKKNYEVEDDNVLVEIDPDSGKFNVALVQNVVVLDLIVLLDSDHDGSLDLLDQVLCGDAALMLQHGESFKKFIVRCCHFSGSSCNLLSYLC